VDVLDGLDALPGHASELPEVDVPAGVARYQDAALQAECQAGDGRILPRRRLPQLHHLGLPAFLLLLLTSFLRIAL